MLERESAGNILEALGDIFLDDISSDDDPETVVDMRDVGGALKVLALGVDARVQP